MIKADVLKIKEYLMALPMDTAEDVRLLEAAYEGNNTETKSVLIVGDAMAAPFLLLPMETQIFTEDDILSFPIDVVWGETFSVSVVNGQGKHWNRYCLRKVQRT